MIRACLLPAALSVAAMIAACSSPQPTVKNVEPAAGAGLEGDREWETVLAAAHREGKVVVAHPIGEMYRRALETFQQTFPGIELELVPIHIRDFIPRYREEMAAGKYLWDVHIGGPDVEMYKLAHEGGWDPVPPVVIRTDILDDRYWRGGFAAGFSDKTKSFAYNFLRYRSPVLYVNRDFIPEAELQTVNDLWDPRWRGKIVWHDPRRAGSGTNSATVIVHRYGEEALRKLWTEQAVVVSGDQRQIIEWVIRGRYPIAAGLIPRELIPFREQGLGLNVKGVEIPGLVVEVAGSNSLHLSKNPPHPNARKIFVNWLLSKEGQTAVSRATKENSRRLDVPVVDPALMVPEGDGEVMPAQSEEFEPTRVRVNQIARETFK